MGEDGLPKVDYSKCTGCKLCSNECPQALLKNIPRDDKGSIAICSNHNPLRSTIRKTCKIGCIKCGICVKNCPQQCITLVNGIPDVDHSKCISCGTCAEKCPTKVMKLLQRDLIGA
jgi:ferredoxin